ncbi:MAG: hypothetical protein ABR923_14410, partial [Terracidiphilus sp.]
MRTAQAVKKMLWPDVWGFCRKSECKDQSSDFGRHGRLLLGQRLAEVKTDALKMHARRAALTEEGNAWEIGNPSDEEVIDQTAELLISGRLHTHIRAMRVFTGEGMPFQQDGRNLPHS